MGKYGEYAADGTYNIYTVNTPTSWENRLFNDEYVCCLSQRMCGKSCYVDNYNQIEIIDENREFFVKINDKYFRLFSGNALSYNAQYGINKTTVTEKYEDFTVTFEVLVPPEGKNELWRISFSEMNGDAELFCFFPFVNKGPMGAECNINSQDNYIYKYSFPYHVFYEDMEKVKNNYAYSYIWSNRKITSFDGSKQSFYGCDNPYEIPAAVKNGRCSNTPGQGSDVECAVHFSVGKNDLEKSLTLVIGCARSADGINTVINSFTGFEDAKSSSDKKWQEYLSAYHIATPDNDVNALFNYWLKKQCVYLTRLNRSSPYCPIRNQLQDALGYSMIDPMGAFEMAMKVLKRQHKNGYIKQWYMTDGSAERDLCKIEHSDGCIWLILCITEIINNAGEKNLFYKEIEYADSTDKATVLEHLKNAARYMYSKRGAHGLCLMLDGDWTDPINGAGRKGRGESVWNSMALIYAINQLVRIFPDKELQTMAESLKSAINQSAWDGKWYIAGFDDEGRAFGTHNDEEGSLFLNTQTWAIISGVASKERTNAIQESLKQLETPFGYLLLTPAFSQWNPTWGRISIKQKGTTENGSVYCHATMFKAYSDCVRGDFNAAYDAVLRTLPVNPDNPPEKNLQLPTFVPNYYFGLQGVNYGKSSCNYSTGTTAWLIWVMIKHILGIKTTVDSIEADENFMKEFAGSNVERRYKGEIFKFTLGENA